MYTSNDVTTHDAVDTPSYTNVTPNPSPPNIRTDSPTSAPTSSVCVSAELAPHPSSSSSIPSSAITITALTYPIPATSNAESTLNPAVDTSSHQPVSETDTKVINPLQTLNNNHNGSINVTDQRSDTSTASLQNVTIHLHNHRTNNTKDDTLPRHNHNIHITDTSINIQASKQLKRAAYSFIHEKKSPWKTLSQSVSTCSMYTCIGITCVCVMAALYGFVGTALESNAYQAAWYMGWPLIMFWLGPGIYVLVQHRKKRINKHVRTPSANINTDTVHVDKALLDTGRGVLDRYKASTIPWLGKRAFIVKSYIAWIALVYQFFQLSNFAFLQSFHWSSHPASLSNTFHNISIDIQIDFFVSFWLLVSLYVTNFILYVGLKTADYCQITNKVTRFIEILLKTLATELLMELLYIAAIRTFFAMVSCTYTTDGNGRAYLDRDPSVTCWQGLHVGFAVVAFIMAIGCYLFDLYYVSSIKPGSKQAIRSIAFYQISYALLKVPVCAVSTLLSTYAWPCALVLFISVAALLTLCIVMQPYVGNRGVLANNITVAVLSGACWSSVCAIIAIALSNDTSVLVPALYLCALLPIMALAAFLNHKRSSPLHADRISVRERAIIELLSVHPVEYTAALYAYLKDKETQKNDRTESAEVQGKRMCAQAAELTIRRLQMKKELDIALKLDAAEAVHGKSVTNALKEMQQKAKRTLKFFTITIFSSQQNHQENGTFTETVKHTWHVPSQVPKAKDGSDSEEENRSEQKHNTDPQYGRQTTEAILADFSPYEQFCSSTPSPAHKLLQNSIHYTPPGAHSESTRIEWAELLLHQSYALPSYKRLKNSSALLESHVYIIILADPRTCLLYIYDMYKHVLRSKPPIRGVTIITRNWNDVWKYLNKQDLDELEKLITSSLTQLSKALHRNLSIREGQELNRDSPRSYSVQVERVYRYTYRQYRQTKVPYACIGNKLTGMSGEEMHAELMLTVEHQNAREKRHKIHNALRAAGMNADFNTIPTEAN